MPGQGQAVHFDSSPAHDALHSEFLGDSDGETETSHAVLAVQNFHTKSLTHMHNRQGLAHPAGPEILTRRRKPLPPPASFSGLGGWTPELWAAALGLG